MNNPVLCPYCGAEMKVHAIPTDESRYTDHVRYYGECWCIKGCQSVSPIAEGENKKGYSTREEAKQAAIQLAQRRYGSPVKPLTWNELLLHKDDVVYLEDQGVAKILVAILPEITAEYACFRDAYRFFYVEKNDMHIRWRAWSRRPTDEERRAAKWEK